MVNPSGTVTRRNAWGGALGCALLALGRFGEAVSVLEKARLLKPDSFEVHYHLGIALRELGRFREADESNSRSIELRSGSCSLSG